MSAPASKTPVPATPLPEFTSNRLRLLGPLITPRVVELAHERIQKGENFFAGKELRVPDDSRIVKIALLLAHEMNPFEDFSAEEEGLIRGIHSDTLRARKKAHLIRPL